MLTIRKLRAFDGLEMVRTAAIQMDAPKHFHEGYAIGIATEGLQTIVLENGQYIISPQSFMLLNPREVHAHKQHHGTPWSHKMLYLSPEYVGWLQKKGKVAAKGDLRFSEPITQNHCLYGNFSNLHDLLTFDDTSGSDRRDTPSHPTTAPLTATNLFDHCISTILNTYASSPPVAHPGPSLQNLEEVRYYLDSNLQHKLNLERLSAQFRIDKYQLIRKFRAFTGLTPNEYLNVSRVEAAKRYISEGESLIGAGFRAGFYDQSHFTHSFLRYACTTPGQFQHNCL